MKTSAIIWTIVIIAVVIVGGVLIWMNVGSPSSSPANEYGTVGVTSTPAGADTGTSPSSSANNTSGSNTGVLGTLTLNTSANATLGTFLVASNGMTLYRYTPDTPGKSTCTGQCAVVWPPYTVSSANTLTGALAVTGVIGTTQRADGSLQITYNGQPLYFYDKDAAPGDVNGQNVGGVWFVVNP